VASWRDRGFFLSNWRQPMPLNRKLWLFARNSWIKLRHRQACCGHPGEPGCWEGPEESGPDSHHHGEHNHHHPQEESWCRSGSRCWSLSRRLQALWWQRLWYWAP